MMDSHVRTGNDRERNDFKFVTIYFLSLSFFLSCLLLMQGKTQRGDQTEPKSKATCYRRYYK